MFAEAPDIREGGSSEYQNTALKKKSSSRELNACIIFTQMEYEYTSQIHGNGTKT